MVSWYLQASLLESCFLKERLLMLPLQAEVLDSVFGLKQATVLLEQVTSSLRDRDLLHNNLLQRKSKLQVSRYPGAGRCVLGTDAPPPGEAGPSPGQI